MLSGVLNIGISYTFAPVLMEAVKDFTRQYPGVRLNIICRTMEELLKKREVDFVLCFKPNFKDEEIESHILFDNQLSVIVNIKHPLAERKSLKIEELLPYRIVMPAHETQARHACEYFFPGMTEKLNVLPLRGHPLSKGRTDSHSHRCAKYPDGRLRPHTKESLQEKIRATNAVLERANDWLK